LGAQVVCTDGVCGHAVYVLIDPIMEKVTHLVVRTDYSPNTEYIVPVETVSATVADTIQLHCNKAELEHMDPFVQTQFVQEKVIDYAGYRGGMYGMGTTYYMPYVTSEMRVPVTAELQQIPPGELAVERGTRIEATDGPVGRVDEFVVNPENGHITHLVMREGHMWGQKDIMIPVSAIGETHDRIMFLKLNKHEIESLPTFPVRRRWS
jgi:hypothetical protein